MTTAQKTETDHIMQARQTLLQAIHIHVVFDGWTEAALKAAVEDTGLDPTLVRAACPRGAIDLAVAFHRKGDAEMAFDFETTDTAQMRIRDKIILAVRLRLQAAAQDRDSVRRAVALFALPQNAVEGAALIWGTADAIWTALGDESRDLNWYTKRASLSAVYSATVLFWLGDDSEGFSETWAFLDRRIGDVMAFETAKARFRDTPFGKAFAAGPGRIFEQVRAPQHSRSDLPGRLG